MVASGYGAVDRVSKLGDTMTGPLVLSGSPPLQIPPGAASGYVWTSDGSGNGAWSPPSGSAGQFSAAGVKTANYTAAAGEFVPVNVASGNVTVTLPSAPADQTRIAVKLIATNTTATHTVTIATSGTDVFNTAGGPTTLSLSLLSQAVILQYAASPNIWYVQAGDLSLGTIKNLFADWVNVRSYGATGNGSTDDTTAVLAAISSATASTPVKAVYFPAGTYLLSSGITMQSGLTLIGETLHEKGFSKRSIITNTTTDTFVWGGSGATDTTQRPEDILIQGLTFTGSTSVNWLTPENISATGAYPLDLNIIGCGLGTYTTILNGAFLRLKLIDSYIGNCTSSPLQIGGSDSYILRNYIDSYIAGTQSGQAVVFLQAQETVFAENYITCCPAMGIKVGSWSIGMRIVNNEINGLAVSSAHGGNQYADGPGIYISHGARGVVIAHNAIGNVVNNPWTASGVPYDAAICVVDASDITVKDNTIDNVISSSGNHLRVTQNTGTVNRIKISGNTYTTGQNSDVAPKVAMSGTMTNVSLDEWGAVSLAVAGVPADSSFPVAPPDGALATNTTNNTLYVRSGGSWNAISSGGTTNPCKPVAGINSTVTVTNTTTETALATYTINAGTALQGDTYRIYLSGTGDIGTSGGTLSFNVRIGGVSGPQITGVQWTLGGSALSTKAFNAIAEVCIRGNASSSTTLACGMTGYNNVVTSGQNGINYGMATADLTANKDLVITAKFSAADASHTVRAEVITIDKMR